MISLEHLTEGLRTPDKTVSILSKLKPVNDEELDGEDVSQEQCERTDFLYELFYIDFVKIKERIVELLRLYDEQVLNGFDEGKAKRFSRPDQCYTCQVSFPEDRPKEFQLIYLMMHIAQNKNPDERTKLPKILEQVNQLREEERENLSYNVREEFLGIVSQERAPLHYTTYKDYSRETCFELDKTEPKDETDISPALDLVQSKSGATFYLIVANSLYFGMLAMVEERLKE